jgi:hypothetical protein
LELGRNKDEEKEAEERNSKKVPVELFSVEITSSLFIEFLWNFTRDPLGLIPPSLSEKFLWNFFARDSSLFLVLVPLELGRNIERETPFAPLTEGKRVVLLLFGATHQKDETTL